MSDFAIRRSFSCSCGRTHSTTVNDVITGKGAISRLGEALARYGARRVFVMSDPVTYEVAGKGAAELIGSSGMEAVPFVFGVCPKPSEEFVGSAVEHYDSRCDAIVSVGSGVLCDIGKILAHLTGRPYVMVATAPSCDAFASASSSMERDGLKVSLPTCAPDVIIGDTDILKTAPDRMLAAGLGDMLAKYVSICEWRISHIINDEYYCPAIADMVRLALDKCVKNSGSLMRREDRAVEAVFEGLVLCGAAMAYAGVSRPASGNEHYISHLIDMRSLEFGTPGDLHGIQCGVATLYIARLYERLREIRPDRERALAHARAFDAGKWNDELRGLLGGAAEPMIALEKEEGKYDIAGHAKRLERIIARWDDIMAVISEEIPPSKQIEDILLSVGAPARLAEIGIEEELFSILFKASKDIRDKYVLSRLVWDLGIEELMQKV
ncbi:MAG: sn-glycerol-1-phosphate dehydrogenase [Lachnospiraceae bacterium]|nr:sn-glycerol-1-phosphate dehydrogenase [Lachnospiraceae bacterium]